MDYAVILASGTSRLLIDRIADDVYSTPENFEILYNLLFCQDINIAWKAAWAVEKIIRKFPEILNRQQINSIIDLLLNTKHSGQQRILLSILYSTPFDNPINVSLLNSCFDFVSSDKYPVAVQSLALKVLVKFCQIENELIPELEAYLEGIENQTQAPAVQSSVRFALKALRKKK